MVTRLKQRQISSSAAGQTELSEQIGELEDRTATNESDIRRVDFVKGRVATRSDLPTGGSLHGDIWLVANETNLYQWDDFINDWTNISSKPDPAIGDRLTNLENVTETFVNTYVESFTNPVVDTGNTTAIVGKGYVKAGGNFLFEPFDNNTLVDNVNSSGILISNGKMTIPGASGTYITNTKTVADNIEFATIEPNHMNYTTPAWKQTLNIGGRGPGTRYSTFVDSNNRVWYVYGATGNVYYKVYNSDGTMYKNETAIPGTTTCPQYQTTSAVHNVSGALDGAGNLWVIYSYYTYANYTYTYYLYYCAVKPDGSMLVNQTALWSGGGAGGNGAVPYSAGAETDKNGRVWLCWGNNTSSSWNPPFFAIYNTNGTVAVSPKEIVGLPNQGSSTYQTKMVYDRTRDKMNFIQIHTDGYLFTASADANGNLTRSFSSINVKVDRTMLSAIYDPDYDQVVIFATARESYTNGALKIVKVSGATLDYVGQWDYCGGINGNLGRPNGIAKPSSTNSGNAGSTPASRALDGQLQYGYFGYSWMFSVGEISWVYWMVDLGNTMPVGLIRVWNGAHADNYNENWCKSFTVAVSNDGTNWTDLQTFTNADGETNFDTWSPAGTTARYVKVYKFGNVRYTSMNTGLSEVEIYPPLAIESLVTSANAGGGYTSMGTSAVKKGNQYYLAYPSVKYNGTYPTICTAIIDASTMVATSADNKLSAVGVTGTRPHPYNHPDGSLRIAYMTSDGAISEGTYISTPTAINYYLSNDGGTTWLQATPNQQLNFITPNKNLKVKIVMTSPQAPTTPEIFDYLVRYWNSTTPTSMTTTYVSGKLPAVQVISKAILSSVQTLNGGTIAWYMSNNGGATWVAATLGQQVVFNNLIGPDLRIKAVLQCNINAQLPTITQFTLVTSEMASAIDIHDVQTNLMKTNFKLDSHTNASKNGMKNLVIDVFNDTTGIDASKSTYTFDNTNKCVSGTVVQSSADTTATAPVNILLTTDEVPGTGTLTYLVSRDGGTTWTGIVPGMVASISSQPVGTSLVMKVQFTGNAKLNAWAYAWS